MAGHYGDERVTTLNLEVVALDSEKEVLYLKGAVPGKEGAWVMLRDAVKKKTPQEVPFPAAFIDLKGGQGQESLSAGEASQGEASQTEGEMA